jgi:glycine cleavage system transcriptional repressor
VTHRYVISVLVADRVGILRGITAAITDLGANIDGISQTVVAGYFTVILTASFPTPRAADEIRAAILGHFTRDEAAVLVRPYAAAARRPPVQGDRYVLTLSGTDRPGILKAVTAFLTERGINIEDWYVHFQAPGVTHIGAVTVPALLDLKHVQDEFRQLAAGLGLTASVQHENIFRVMNEVGPVQPLLAEKHHVAQ